jgi:transcriptional regulator with XRE-family HTH domain
MNFPEKLQKLRKERGWSQEELANRITVSRQAVSKWELGVSLR